MRPGVRLLALGSSLVLVRPALASEVVELTVDEGCERVERAQLARLLEIERRRAFDTELRDARVSVACSDGVATLTVSRRALASPAPQRTFALEDVRGEIGARVLALAAIELLESPPPEPPAPPPPPPLRPVSAPPSPPPPLPPPLPHVRLLAVGTAQTFAFAPPLLGGGIAVDYLRLSRFAFRLGFDVAVSERGYDLGRARAQLTTLNAQAGYFAQHRDWSARALVGYRLGAARISGAAPPGALAQTGTVAGPCGGPLVSGGLGLSSRGLLAELGMEAGLVSFPLEGRVEGHDAIALDGYWVSLSLSVGALL